MQFATSLIAQLATGEWPVFSSLVGRFGSNLRILLN